MERREFVKLVGTGSGVLALGSTMVGCNVWTDILNWEPIGVDALNSIIAVLAANGFPVSGAVQQIVSDINAGFMALAAAVKEYQSTTPPPVGALQKVEAAFQAIVDQFGAFFTSLNLPGGNLFNLIASLVKIVLDTIAGFENRLPSGTVTLTRVFKTNRLTIPIKPTARSRRAFKHDFNAELTGPTATGLRIPPNAKLPLSFWENF